MMIALSILSIGTTWALSSAKAFKISTDRKLLVQRIHLSIQHSSKMAQALSRRVVLRADPRTQALEREDKTIIHFNGHLSSARFGNVGPHGADDIVFYESGRNSAGSFQLQNPSCKVIVSSLGAVRSQC